MLVYIQLFWEFFKTGLFAIGGGMATVPFLQAMSVKTGWFSAAQLADMIAVAESTPGPLGVNTATYVGYIVGLQQGGVFSGLLGGIIATLGVITPSIIIIMIIAGFLDRFRDNRFVKGAFYGLRPSSVGLIAAAGVSIVLISFFQVSNVYDVWNGMTSDWRQWLLGGIILICTRWVPKLKDLHAIWFIAASAVIGVALGLGH